MHIKIYYEWTLASWCWILFFKSVNYISLEAGDKIDAGGWEVSACLALPWEAGGWFISPLLVRPLQKQKQILFPGEHWGAMLQQKREVPACLALPWEAAGGWAKRGFVRNAQLGPTPASPLGACLVIVGSDVEHLDWHITWVAREANRRQVVAFARNVIAGVKIGEVMDGVDSIV